MSLWSPAYEQRGSRGHWLNNAKLAAIGMSELAARYAYDHFCLFPTMLNAANDRDDKRW